jgi:hypothetical protein
VSQLSLEDNEKTIGEPHTSWSHGIEFNLSYKTDMPTIYLWFSVQDVVIKDILLSFAHYSHAVRAGK